MNAPPPPPLPSTKKEYVFMRKGHSGLIDRGTNRKRWSKKVVRVCIGGLEKTIRPAVNISWLKHLRELSTSSIPI